MGLFRRREHVGRAVQIEAVFPERFPVVGHVDHRRIECLGMGAQLVDYL